MKNRDNSTCHLASPWGTPDTYCIVLQLVSNIPSRGLYVKQRVAEWDMKGKPGGYGGSFSENRLDS